MPDPIRSEGVVFDELSSVGDRGDQHFGSADDEQGTAGKSAPALPSDHEMAHRPGPTPGRRFGKPQLLVIAAIVALGIGLAGWAVLRARPVALAAPRSSSSASTGHTGSNSHPTRESSATATNASAAAVSAASDGTAAGPEQASATPKAPKITVHVTGAVHKPGVLQLRQGARIEDALHKAGGTTHRAELGRLNLAQPLSDGQQLVVATKGRSGKSGGKSKLRDPVPAGGSSGSGTQAGDDPGAGPATGNLGAGQKINLNTASESQLQELSGVGPVTAHKIVDWRKQNGKFSTTKELQEVNGIGPKTFADLAGHVTVS
jgi:competence protein ComEA